MEESVPLQITGYMSDLQWMKWALNPATDPDVWFCSAMKYDGTDYYQYVLLYTDDILVIMKTLNNVYFMRWVKYFP